MNHEILLILFSFFKKLKTKLMQTLVNLYKYTVLVTRVRIFCTILFTNNKIKGVIKMHSFQSDRFVETYIFSTPHLQTIL